MHQDLPALLVIALIAVAVMLFTWWIAKKENK